MNNLEILEELKQELENNLQAEYITNNKVEKLQNRVNKLIEKKKIQIKALDNVIDILKKIKN